MNSELKTHHLNKTLENILQTIETIIPNIQFIKWGKHRKIFIIQKINNCHFLQFKQSRYSCNEKLQNCKCLNIKVERYTKIFIIAREVARNEYLTQ